MKCADRTDTNFIYFLTGQNPFALKKRGLEELKKRVQRVEERKFVYIELYYKLTQFAIL